MSVTLKKDSWKIKGGNGTYRDSAIFSTTLPEDAAAIVAEATSAIDAQQIRATDIVDTATDEIDTIVQRVNDLVDTGTDTTLTQAGAAADAKAAGDAIGELKSALQQNIYGVDESYDVVAGTTNKYPVLLIKDMHYTVTNNTGVAITVLLYKDDGTSKTISSQLSNGNSITFSVDADDYTQIGGWVNAGATGTIDLVGEFSTIGIESEFNSAIIGLQDVLYNYSDASVDATAAGWRLNELDGLCSSNSSYKMLKYKVSAGTWMKIHSDDRFQFQTVASVPSSGTSNRVGQTYGIGDYILEVPNTATYLIVSTPTTSTAAVYYCIEKTAVNAEKIDGITKIADIDVTASATKHANEFYNSNNQIYAGGGQWDYYTLAVSVGQSYTIDTVAGGTVRGWAFRDSSQNQISIESYSGDVVQKKYEDVIVPANAVEMIVNCKFVSGYVTIVQNNADVVDENKVIYKGKKLSQYLDDIDGKSGNILAGKILCCCGDSITYGADMSGDELVTPTINAYQYSAYTKNWTKWEDDEPAAYGYQIAARNGMTFYNGGVSGACVQGSGGTSTVPGFSVEDGEYTLLPENIDYLTLFFGWNDTEFGSLGTINDTTNDSYYGGYNVVLPYLINKYPYTKIALVVPFGTDVGHRQAIRDLANKWGVACFDLYKEGMPLYYGKEPEVNVDQSIITANRAKFQANGAHPNYQGHYLIGTMLEQFLRGI